MLVYYIPKLRLGELTWRVHCDTLRGIIADIPMEEDVSTESTVRFAVVGVKGYSRSHLRYISMLEEQDRGQLVASTVVDRYDHPDAVAELEQRGVQVFDDYETMLRSCRDDVDIVTLPTPIYLHAPMTVAALRAGYHVFVEKPVAGSLAEADEMIDVRSESGKQCAVGFQQLYSHAFQRLKAHIADGKLGKIRRISNIALWPRPPAYYARNEWAGRLSCGGRPVYDSPFNNALAHQIMNMLYLASAQKGSSAHVTSVEAELYRAYDIESFDTGCMRARTDTGVEILFAATHACQTTLDPIMRVEAERALVEWRIGGSPEIKYVDGSTETVPESSPHAAMILNIADAVQGIAPAPTCTLEIGRAHVECIEKVHRAAPIHTVPDRFVSVRVQEQRVIDGVERAVRQAFDTGALFSEQRAPFACAVQSP